MKTFAQQNYERIVGLKAITFSPNKMRGLNQYYIRHTFPDGSYLDVSSSRCPVNLNQIRYTDEFGGVSCRQLFKPNNQL